MFNKEASETEAFLFLYSFEYVLQLLYVCSNILQFCLVLALILYELVRVPLHLSPDCGFSFVEVIQLFLKNFDIAFAIVP